ncbi:MAG: hypothetical protein ABW252_07585 [Polyangiales bacterium]
MKVVAASTVWLTIALVAVPVPHASAEPPAPIAPAAAPPPTFFEPGTDVHETPEAPVGSCIGGDCLDPPKRRGAPTPLPRSAARAAYGAALFGTVAAGLVLGGAIAIAAVDDPGSEKITRGLWLGTMALSPPIVGFTAYLARRQRTVEGMKSARRLGWVSYSSAVTGGVLGWVGAFRDETTPSWLTVSGGVFGVLCLLPVALDALVSARGARTTPPVARLVPRLNGLGVRF